MARGISTAQLAALAIDNYSEIMIMCVQGSGDSNCYNLYRIEASPSNQGTPLTQGPMFPTVSGGGDISVSVTSGLVRNTVYSVNIVSVNVNGENSSMGDIQFSKSSQSHLLTLYK